jgi:hypothetical protein
MLKEIRKRDIPISPSQAPLPFNEGGEGYVKNSLSSFS